MNEVRQAQHTPAPWYWQEFGTRGSDGPSAFRIEAGTGTVADTYAYSALDEANARLIAAAPELLEALQDIAEGRNVPDDLLALDAHTFRSEWIALIQKRAREAIAKATGGAL